MKNRNIYLKNKNLSGMYKDSNGNFDIDKILSHTNDENIISNIIIGSGHDQDSKFFIDCIPNTNIISRAHITVNNITIRRQLQLEGFYTAVAWDWVIKLAKILKGKKVLEVMAGRGWLSLALKHLGIDVISTDNYSWDRDTFMGDRYIYNPLSEKVTNVEKTDALKAVKKYAKDVDYIIMAWPQMDDTTDIKVFTEMTNLNKKCQMIYIGEGYGGCTGSDEFHDSAELFPLDVGYKSYSSINDEVCIVKPRTAN